MALSNEGIELKIYSYTDPSIYLDTIQEAQNKQYLEGLGEVGSGSFQVAIDEPKTNDSDSGLLNYRNVCKYSIDGKIVGAFLLEKNKKILVSEGERNEQRREITGNGLLTWLSETMVGPMMKQTRYGADKRYFNFATKRGAWYKPADWNDSPPIMGKWGDAPWFKRPTNWPKDHKAKWIKASTNQWNNVQSLFRLEFTTGDDGGRWIIWAAGDDYLEMWLDGEKIANTDFQKDSFTQATKIELDDLPAGDHVLAARVTNKDKKSAFMAAVYHPGVESQDNNPKTLRLYTGQPASEDPHIWRSMFLGADNVPMPVWTPGQIILQLMGESANRGNKAMNWLTPTFTGTKDSNGVDWLTTEDDWEFAVGQDSLYTVMQKISEKLGYYFWIDPDTLNLNMAQYRGTDRSVDPNAIVFELGKNLFSAELEGDGNKRRNLFWAKGSDGWLVDPVTKDTASYAKYGALEGYYSADMPTKDMKRVLPAIIKQTAMAEEGATYKVATDEYEPWRHFFNGDLVVAPDKDGLNRARQVVSLSFSEDDDTGEPEYTVEFDVIFQTQSKKLEMAIAKIVGGSAGSGLASSSGLGSTQLQPQLPPSTQPAPVQPLIPQNLVATSDGTWTPDGITPVSTVHLAWDPVTLDSAGNEIIIQYYEIWGTKASEPQGMRLLTQSNSPKVDITPLTPGELWRFQVRAFVDQATASDFSSVITYAGEGPNDPLPAPSAPILSTAMGLLNVRWDGILTDEAEPAPQFRYVYAQVAVGESGPWAIAGSAISRGGGDTSIPGLNIGDTYFVRLKAVDGIGLVSEPSEMVSIEIEGVDLGPLQQEIDDAIADIGKAVTDVRQNVNMLDNPSFEQPATGQPMRWTFGANTGLSMAEPRTGTWHVAINSDGTSHDAVTYTDFIPADPGISFYLKFYVIMESGSAEDGELEMGMYVKADEADTPTYVKMADSLAFDDTGYQIFQGYFTVPDGMRWMQPVVRINDQTAGDVIYLDDARMFVMTDETTVVPGSINADALAAGSVIAGKLAAGSVDTEALQAESILGIHIKGQEITGDKMAFNTLTGNHMEVGSIGVESLSPTIGDELDISANGAVNIIVGRIQDIEDSDYAQNSDLEQMQTYYAFTDDGAIVSTPGSPFAVAVRSDKIEMLENGNSVSYWNSGTLYVDQMVGSSVVLGNHQLQQYDDGTVVRAIN